MYGAVMVTSLWAVMGALLLVVVEILLHGVMETLLQFWKHHSGWLTGSLLPGVMGHHCLSDPSYWAFCSTTGPGLVWQHLPEDGGLLFICKAKIYELNENNAIEIITGVGTTRSLMTITILWRHKTPATYIPR